MKIIHYAKWSIWSKSFVNTLFVIVGGKSWTVHGWAFNQVDRALQNEDKQNVWGWANVSSIETNVTKFGLFINVNIDHNAICMHHTNHFIAWGKPTNLGQWSCFRVLGGPFWKWPFSNPMSFRVNKIILWGENKSLFPVFSSVRGIFWKLLAEN